MSGLVEALKVVDGIEGIATVYFDERDVVRHALVQQIVKAYETLLQPAQVLSMRRAPRRSRRRRPARRRHRRAGPARRVAAALAALARARGAADARAGAVDASRSSPTRVMRRLNRDVSRQGHATDVLSFPDRLGPAGQACVGTAGSGRMPGPDLGDIAIATGVARARPASTGTRWRTELRILALHGLLHLLGYDHETDQGEMARLEERLRRRAGLPAGLIARTPGRPRRR